jgi:hypothetical protein
MLSSSYWRQERNPKHDAELRQNLIPCQSFFVSPFINLIVVILVSRDTYGRVDSRPANATDHFGTMSTGLYLPLSHSGDQFQEHEDSDDDFLILQYPDVRSLPLDHWDNSLLWKYRILSPLIFSTLRTTVKECTLHLWRI